MRRGDLIRSTRAGTNHAERVEVHGGSWQQGRHQRGAGFTRDRQKMVAAIELGWRVLEFTDEDLRTRPVQVIEQIRKVLANVPERD